MNQICKFERGHVAVFLLNLCSDSSFFSSANELADVVVIYYSYFPVMSGLELHLSVHFFRECRN